jgi:hypothetical protein
MKKNDTPFKFPLPTGWDDQSAYHFVGPEEGGINHTITLYVDRYLQQQDIASFARQHIDPIVNMLEGVEVLKDEDVSVDGGNPVWEFVYRWIPAEGIVKFYKYVFVFWGGMGFTFSCEFSKHTLKTVGSQFPDIVDAVLPGTYEPLDEDD